MSPHAQAQLNNRGMDKRLIELAEYLAAKCTCDTAIRLATVGQKQYCQDGSNGSEIWAIVRKPRGEFTYSVQTFFFRRETQSKHPSAFGVQNVVIYS